MPWEKQTKIHHDSYDNPIKAEHTKRKRNCYLCSLFSFSLGQVTGTICPKKKWYVIQRDVSACKYFTSQLYFGRFSVLAHARTHTLAHAHVIPHRSLLLFRPWVLQQTGQAPLDSEVWSDWHRVLVDELLWLPASGTINHTNLPWQVQVSLDSPLFTQPYAHDDQQDEKRLTSNNNLKNGQRHARLFVW